MGVCDICGDACSDKEMESISASRISKVTKQGFVPYRLPEILKAQASESRPVSVLWKMAVKVNDSDWGVCDACATLVRGFSRHATPRILFAELMRSHRARLLAVDHPDHKFIEKILADDNLKGLAVYASEAIVSTETDGQAHFKSVWIRPMYFGILAFPGSVDEAAAWIEREHGGYGAMLDKFMADGVIGTIYCHVTFGVDGANSWLNLALLPRVGTRFRSHPIVPTDLMTNAERAQYPNAEEHEADADGDALTSRAREVTNESPAKKWYQRLFN